MKNQLLKKYIFDLQQPTSLDPAFAKDNANIWARCCKTKY